MNYNTMVVFSFGLISFTIILNTFTIENVKV